MIRISPTFFLDDSELELSYIRSPGPGGQNVNKVATTVQLRFNVVNSPSIPEEIRARFIQQNSSKITLSGDIIIKASRFRTQEANREDAIERLVSLLQLASIRPKKRRKTKPTYGSVQDRLKQKKQIGNLKKLRSRKAGRDD